METRMSEIAIQLHEIATAIGKVADIIGFWLFCKIVYHFFKHC